MRTGRFFVLLLAALVLSAFVIPAAAQDDMESTIRAGINRVIEEGFNQGNTDVVDEICAPDYIAHPEETDCEAFKQEILANRAAIPDMVARVDHLIVEGNLAAFVFTARGTFTNPFGEGDMAIPPTGNPVEITGDVMLRFNDEGQLVEEWDVFDNLAIGMQLGVIPTPEGGAMMATEEAMPESEMMEEDIAPGGSEEANKAAVQQLIAEITENNLDAIDALVAEDFAHTEVGITYDLAGMKEALTAFRAAVPDFYLDIEQQVAEGNWVATRFVFRGTFSGELMNPDGSTVPGNNNTIDSMAIVFSQLDEEGKVVANWLIYDQLTFLQEMGIIPEMETEGE